MKSTLILISLLILFHLSSALRTKHKANTLADETNKETSIRKKIKNFAVSNETKTTTSTESATKISPVSAESSKKTTTEAEAETVAAPAKEKTEPANAKSADDKNATVIKKVDTSGAGPMDVNAQGADTTGIETNETSPPISRCTQSIGVVGHRIKDVYNLCIREPAHLKMNIWNVNIFEKKDPSTLIASAEWTNIDFPVKNITGAPECMLFQASAENGKKFAFCLSKEEDLDTWYDAILTFKLCRDGITPSKGKKNCVNQSPNMVSYTDPLTGRSIQVEDQSQASRIGGGGSGGCVNCGK